MPAPLAPVIYRIEESAINSRIKDRRRVGPVLSAAIGAVGVRGGPVIQVRPGSPEARIGMGRRAHHKFGLGVTCANAYKIDVQACTDAEFSLRPAAIPFLTVLPYLLPRCLGRDRRDRDQ